MRKISVLTAVLLLGCNLQAQSSEIQEFINDGGFENYPSKNNVTVSTEDIGTLKNAFKLVIKNDSKGSSEIVDSEIHSGKQALKVQLDAIDYRYRFFAAYDMEKLAPTLYTLSFWMKASEAGMDFRVDLLNATVDLSKTAKKTTAEWSKYEIQVDLSNISASDLAVTRLAIRFNCTSGGGVNNKAMTYYLDDVSVTGVVPKVILFEPSPYLQSKTQNTIRINWQSAVGEEGTPTVEYGTTDLSNSATGVVASVGKISWSGVKIEGLLPNTEYQYRCRIGENISKIFKFRTMPTNDVAGRKIRFVSFGDTHEASTATNVRNSALITLKGLYGEDLHNYIDFVVSTGDNVTKYGQDIDDWTNTFFKPNRTLSASLPYLIAAGNHDFEKNDSEHSFFYDLMNYEDLSEVEGEAKGKYFSQQVGNALFIYLNSNMQYLCESSDSRKTYQDNTTAQLDWLKTKLENSEKDASIDMIVVFAHHGYRNEMWSEKGEEGYSKKIKERLYPVFEASTKIQVFQYGHTHAGERGVLELENGHSVILYQTGNSGSYPDYYGRYSKYENFPEIHRNYEDLGFSITEIDVDSKTMETKFYSFGQRRIKEGDTGTTYVRDYSKNPQEIDGFKVGINETNPPMPIISSITRDISGLMRVVTEQTEQLLSAQFRIKSAAGTILQDTVVHYEDVFGVTGYFAGAGDKIDLTRSYLPLNLRAEHSLHDFTFHKAVEEKASVEVRFRNFNLKWSDWAAQQVATNINKSLTIPNYYIDGNLLIVNSARSEVKVCQLNGMVKNYAEMGKKSIVLEKGMNIITIGENDLEPITIKVGI